MEGRLGQTVRHRPQRRLRPRPSYSAVPILASVFHPAIISFDGPDNESMRSSAGMVRWADAMLPQSR